MKTTVLITTSGVGAPLGELTKYTNKALIKIGNKPAISHIFDLYPKNTRFVVTLGYFAEQVKDFIALAHADLDIKYVHVNPFVGPGSSLGESMLQARALLQCPFIYHASDTLISEEVPLPNENWIGVARGEDASQYASWTMQEGKLRFHDKGAIGADYIHIGLIGVKDYRSLWNTLQALKNENPDNGSLNDAQVIARLIHKGVKQKVIEFPTWRDIGNVGALQRAQGKQGTHEVLFKTGEAIFIFDSFVVKFFADEKVAANRAKRAKLLKGFMPKLEGARGNFYRYAFVPGESYPDVIDVKDFEKYLAWAQGAFWVKPAKPVDAKIFKEACRKFYEDKTRERIQKFFDITSLQDSEHIINGEKVPKIADMLSRVNFDWLSDGIQSRFHGDFVLDNVVRTKKGYSLVDWRQDFGGLLEVGDRYYDLAKLNHNLSVNHRVINQNLFTVQVNGKTVRCDIMRPDILVDCQKVFHEFLDEKDYDIRKVETLTALNWLNGAALHHHPYNLFLYYFGKLHLWRALQAKK